ncbi:hypothetical protein PUN4_130098 [Paraburkholderia unamae]|nr:hypothetical protein PUN4_130098 [Paraburkholderia unamae]
MQLFLAWSATIEIVVRITRAIGPGQRNNL